MYVAYKVGIVALSAALGVGISYGFWAAQQHDEPPFAIVPVTAPTLHKAALVVASSAPSPPAGMQTSQPIENAPTVPEITANAPSPAPIVVYVMPATVLQSPTLSTDPPPQRSAGIICGAMPPPEDQKCCNAGFGICPSF